MSLGNLRGTPLGLDKHRGSRWLSYFQASSFMPLNTGSDALKLFLANQIKRKEHRLGEIDYFDTLDLQFVGHKPSNHR